MRKEVIIAIILGLTLGVVILYGTYIANQATNKALNSTSASTTAINSQQPPTPISSATPFSVTFPHNSYVSFSDSINLSGTAPANSAVAVISETDEEIIEADDKGNFESEISLIGGENEVTLTTNINNQPEIIKLTIIYTTSDINIESD